MPHAEIKEVVADWLRLDAHRRRQQLPVQGHRLILVGPPGVGKSSIATAIAAALQRPHARITAGSDADDVRLAGVTRYWNGAGPGEIVLALTRAGSLARYCRSTRSR